ncbi:MAG: hypothetical protein IAF94_11600 [Pirellulaceae bacterium]|nr:hypothetical protein [Pirellulaceae bacterium]
MTEYPGWFVRNCCSALLLGGVSLALLSGCGDPAPVTAEKSKFQVAGEDEKQPAKDGSPVDAKGTEKLPGSQTDPLIPSRSPRTGNEPRPEGPSETGEPTEVATVDTTDYGASREYPLPPGGAQEVYEFLEKLGTKKPKGLTKKEQEADYLAIQDSSLAAARKLLTFRIPREAKGGLLQLMMKIHQGFIENKVPDAEQRLEAFAQELSGHKDPEIAEVGRVQAFDLAVNKLAKQDPPPADGKEVAAEIEKFVESTEGSPI